MKGSVVHRGLCPPLGSALSRGPVSPQPCTWPAPVSTRPASPSCCAPALGTLGTRRAPWRSSSRRARTSFGASAAARRREGGRSWRRTEEPASLLPAARSLAAFPVPAVRAASRGTKRRRPGCRTAPGTATGPRPVVCFACSAFRGSQMVLVTPGVRRPGEARARRESIPGCAFTCVRRCIGNRARRGRSLECGRVLLPGALKQSGPGRFLLSWAAHGPLPRFNF